MNMPVGTLFQICLVHGTLFHLSKTDDKLFKTLSSEIRGPSTLVSNGQHQGQYNKLQDDEWLFPEIVTQNEREDVLRILNY